MTAQCQAQVHSTAGALVRVDRRQPCAVCGGRMNVQKTITHGGLTLAHGSFAAHETVLECPRGCKQDGRPVTRRQPELTALLLPRSRVGYDLLTHIGIARFVHHRQREAIRTDLADNHGLSLSTGEISQLGRRFLVYLEALHIRRAPALREKLERDGGSPMHLDATGEAGRGMLLVIYAGWRPWVLGGWKIPSEHADVILAKLRLVQAHFGTPLGLMRDLGRAMIQACNTFVKELDRPIPIWSCHFHLVRDVGKDLLGKSHDELRLLFRSCDVRGRLRALARELSRTLGTDVDPARKEVESWMSAPRERSHQVPDGRAGLAVARALVQWVVDYPADGHDEGFPFDVPYLDLFERCHKAGRALDAFLRNRPAGAAVYDTLQRLQRIVVATHRPDFVRPVRVLQERRALFTELRTALRVEVKPHRLAPAPPGLTPPEVLDEARQVKVALEQLVLSLRDRRPERGPAGDTREAIDIILTHLDRHGDSLWGHAISLPPQAGGGVRLVDRTNIILENFFGGMKRADRKRSGRKDLAVDLEQLPGAAPLASNLERPDYVEVLCGTLDQLPQAFAELDAADRSKSLPTRTLAPSNGADGDVVRASLPKADRKIIRDDRLLDKILAAARSRAPRRTEPQPMAAST